MTDLATGLWQRALDAIRVAKHDLVVSADAAASRAYYAAFYAVSARFALEGKTFARHSAVEAAVHRDLVKAGLWPKDLGERYSMLVELRSISDYGDVEHVSPQEAKDAIAAATAILDSVRESSSGRFPPFQG